MNNEPDKNRPNQPPTPPPLPPPKPGLTKAQRVARITIGFLAGALFWALPFSPFLHNGYDGIPWLIFACFGLPIVSVILAIIRPTRRFGLGLLLASGLGWLILLSICGGMAVFG